MDGPTTMSRALRPSVLLLQETYLPLRGGAELHVYYLTRALQEQGFETSILTATTAKSGESEDCPVYRHRLETNWLFPLRFPVWGWRIFRHGLKNDILHVHYSSFLAAMTGIVGRLLGRHVVMTLHGFGTLDSSAKTRLHRVYRYVSHKLAHRIVATSDEMADVARRFVREDRIVLITNGVDTTAFMCRVEGRFDDIHKELRLLTLRRLVPKNGVQFVVQAVGQLLPKMRCRLDIVGDGFLRGPIAERISRLGIGDVVHLHGELTHREIPAILDRAHIAMFLSTAESTSLAALECMAQGCIVVASNAGAFPDFIEDGKTGFLIDLFTARKSNYDAPDMLNDEQVARVVKTLQRIGAMPPKALEEVASAARKMVEERYGWPHIARRVVTEAYRSGRNP
jgi:glycosyltransferase involved in cell wall biosynthesis